MKSYSYFLLLPLLALISATPISDDSDYTVHTISTLPSLLPITELSTPLSSVTREGGSIAVPKHTLGARRHVHSGSERRKRSLPPAWYDDHEEHEQRGVRYEELDVEGRGESEGVHPRGEVHPREESEGMHPRDAE